MSKTLKIIINHKQCYYKSTIKILTYSPSLLMRRRTHWRHYTVLSTLSRMLFTWKRNQSASIHPGQKPESGSRRQETRVELCLGLLLSSFPKGHYNRLPRKSALGSARDHCQRTTTLQIWEDNIFSDFRASYPGFSILCAAQSRQILGPSDSTRKKPEVTSSKLWHPHIVLPSEVPLI